MTLKDCLRYNLQFQEWTVKCSMVEFRLGTLGTLRFLVKVFAAFWQICCASLKNVIIHYDYICTLYNFLYIIYKCQHRTSLKSPKLSEQLTFMYILCYSVEILRTLYSNWCPTFWISFENCRPWGLFSASCWILKIVSPPFMFFFLPQTECLPCPSHFALLYPRVALLRGKT